jgi:uncharacterized protein (DUF1778 family)
MSTPIKLGDRLKVGDGLSTSEAEASEAQLNVEAVRLSREESQRLLHSLDEPFSPNRKLGDAITRSRQIDP